MPVSLKKFQCLELKIANRTLLMTSAKGQIELVISCEDNWSLQRDCRNRKSPVLSGVNVFGESQKELLAFSQKNS